MEGEELTAAQLRALTGSSAQSIAAAVDALIKRRLLDRLSQQRPQLVFLHSQAKEGLQDLLEQAREAEQQRQTEIDQLVAMVEGAWRRRAERGRPRGRSPEELPSARGRISHDEVLPASDLGSGTASRSWLRCPARVLVTDAGPDFDLRQLAHRQQPGSEVRISRGPLPQMRVLDGERLAGVGRSAFGRAIVWSWDERHVRAAQELFELWWARAEPGVVTPHPLRQPEPEWDVEEWDPADL
jgi:hypothetical protein